MIEKTEFCYKSWILRVAVHCKQNSYIKVCGWWSQNKKKMIRGKRGYVLNMFMPSLDYSFQNFHYIPIN